MKIHGRRTRSIWRNPDGVSVGIFDQTLFPHGYKELRLEHWQDAARAIQSMQTRGAPLIGAVGAYGLALALRERCDRATLDAAHGALNATRPTAVNLRWALDRVRDAVLRAPEQNWVEAAYAEADAIVEEDAAICEAIGDHGLPLIAAALNKKKGQGPVNILTHCNAGWLATTDWGTALAPIYKAHDAGLPVHVWVDETRPRNQGASLTALELKEHGVPHTLVVDNAGGHLMQHGMVDLCIVGTDRTTATGDVANKIGTYLKALAAHDNGVPFYVGLPSSTIDWTIADGVRDIPIEERSPDEILYMTGQTVDGRTETVLIAPEGTRAVNYGFDVTPARLVTGLITERGIAPASREGLLALFPERHNA